jgi:hypothetical protein
MVDIGDFLFRIYEHGRRAPGGVVDLNVQMSLLSFGPKGEIFALRAI